MSSEKRSRQKTLGKTQRSGEANSSTIGIVDSGEQNIVLLMKHMTLFFGLCTANMTILSLNHKMKPQRKSLRSFHWSEIENYTEREIREGKAK